MQHFLVLSDALETTLRHQGNIYKLYSLYTFLREGHHFVLYVLNGEATLWHKVHKLYSFLTVNQQTNKCWLQKPNQPNHAWGSQWLFYDLQCISGRQQWGQFGVAVFYSRANHIHVCECDAPECVYCPSLICWNGIFSFAQGTALLLRWSGYEDFSGLQLSASVDWCDWASLVTQGSIRRPHQSRNGLYLPRSMADLQKGKCELSFDHTLSIWLGIKLGSQSAWLSYTMDKVCIIQRMTIILSSLI